MFTLYQVITHIQGCNARMFQCFRIEQKLKGFVSFKTLRWLKMDYLCENNILILQKCKCGWQDSNLYLFFQPTLLSTYSWGRWWKFTLSNKDDKAHSGSGKHQNPLPTCSFLLRPYREPNGNIDLPHTPNMMIMNHFCSVILQH